MSLIKPAFIGTVIIFLWAAIVAAETSPYFLISRDPFKRPTVPKVQMSGAELADESQNNAEIIVSEATKLKLQAVLLLGANSMANINDKVLAIGDEIAGYRLLEIMANEVVLQKQKVIVKIQLN